MAGELLTAPYQIELRGLLMGPTTRFHTDPDGWGGLGVPGVKSQDFTLDGADGDVTGRDYLTSRVLTFPLGWGGTDAADVMDDLSTLSTAWGPSELADVELHLWLPGWGHFFVVGRPRGLVEDLKMLKSGEGRALATFFAGDPTVYFPDDVGS